jgi:hypothetical protein
MMLVSVSNLFLKVNATPLKRYSVGPALEVASPVWPVSSKANESSFSA